MTHRLISRAGGGFLVAACLGSLAWAQGAGTVGAGKFDGEYPGELTLTKVVSGDCTRPPLGAVYPLTVSGGEVRFAYVPRFNTILTGRVRKDGTFTAAFRVKHGVVRMTGRIRGEDVTARIASPSCRYTFHTRQ